MQVSVSIRPAAFRRTISQDNRSDGHPDGQGRSDPPPAEVRATVRLYLDGKIRQWYSRGDGKGVILLIDARTVEEAHAAIDAMRLSKENLVDHEYIPVGPLIPLGALIAR
jgi:hypothetical protein